MAKFHKGLQYHEDKVEKHKITTEEIEFLKNLQTELNTQDNLGQADPKYWVIIGSERVYSVDEADDYVFYNSCTDENIADNMSEICDYINNDESFDNKYTATYEHNALYNQINISHIDCDGEKIIDILKDKDEIEDWFNQQGCGIDVISYKVVSKVYDNTMFLTQKDAEEHLRNNSHHYSEDAHTYAMTAWRSPRMEKLIKILQEVNWGDKND